jgi:transposase, IS5 family
VNATIIQAPSSNKNASKQCDSDMNQTKKGQKGYFGMKAHIGVDVESGLLHTVTTTPANVSDLMEVAKLLYGKEKTVYADAGYQRAEKRAPKRGRTWHIAVKRGSNKAMPERELKDAVKHTEHMQTAAHSKVEHPFRVVKRQFG